MTVMTRYEDSAIQLALTLVVDKLHYSSLLTGQEVVVKWNNDFVCLPTGNGTAEGALFRSRHLPCCVFKGQ